MAFFKLKHLFYGAGVVLVAAMFLFNRQADFDPIKYSLPSPPELSGAYASNTHLRNAKLLLKGQIAGPESLVVEGNTLYTGTWDARVLKIVDGTIRKVVQLPARSGEKRPDTCGTFDTEPRCGRPLGIRRLNSRQLIVADAYLGLFSVDFDNDKEPVKQLFAPDSTTPKTKFTNDLDVLPDGSSVYFSDSSSKWDRAHFLHAFLEHKPDGRLFRLDLSSGKATVLLDELNFPNGVQLHPDNVSVLVAECSMARIQRYYFAGPKKGQHELFVDNLPGFPDNIRLAHGGKSFLIGLAGVRHSGDLLPFLDVLGPHPIIRTFIVHIVPESFLTSLLHIVSRKHGFVVELALDGKPIRSYQDPSGAIVPDVSQVSDDGTHLYLGSFHSDFIAKVPRKGH